MTDATDEITLIELVVDHGGTVGVAEKVAAHRSPGLLHRAFSVFLFDGSGRMILQRRALEKYHSPGVWSNACCGHPFPTEPPEVAARRRVLEELGLPAVALTSCGTVSYCHVDSITGLVEREFNHLYFGRTELDLLRPDAAEVAQVKAVDARELAALRSTEPFSAWFTTVFEAARPQIADHIFNGAW